MSQRLVLTEFLPMNERDLDAVSALEAELQVFPWTRGHFADGLKAGYSSWVVHRGGQVIGFAVLMIVLDEAHLLNIGIASKLHGQGIGARLLQHILDCAKYYGAVKIFLEVRPSNERAVALYRNFGFSEIGRRKGYYPAPEGREDALVFDKDLT